jgi:putative flippase GtrA
VSAADAGARLVARYRRLPQGLRIAATAVIGAAIGWVFYEIVYALNPLQPRATTSWLIAYFIGIARQHGLHRWLSFDARTPYWPSLRRAYVMYAGNAVVGAALNALLTGTLGLHHRLAWLLCLVTTALISLVFLKSYVFAHQRPTA